MTASGLGGRVGWVRLSALVAEFASLSINRDDRLWQ